MPTTNHSHHVLDTNIPIFRPVPGVFDERQLSEIFYSLEGKGEIPCKYNYFGIGAENWIERSITSNHENDSYKVGSQYKLMNETLDLVLGAVADKNTVNIVDIGCGSGYPSFPIISFLNDKKKLGKYIAIDVVPQMIDSAVKNLGKIDILKNIKIDKYLHDFEDGHFADIMIKERKKGVVNLFTFFGNTLGSMIDRHRALANIRDSMTEGDLLWIGVVLNSSLDLAIHDYSNFKINSSEYLERTKMWTSSLISFGLTDWMNYGHLNVQKVNSEGLVKLCYNITKPFILEFPKFKDVKNILQLKFEVGDKITLCRFNYYKENLLVSEIKEAGFKLKMMNISDDYSSGLVLVSV